MRQTFSIIAFFLFVSIFTGNSVLEAQQRSALLGDTDLGKVGLKKLWQNQIRIDQTREKIAHAIIHDGVIFVISDDAKLHAIDAETGKTMWRRAVGARGRHCLPPAANSRMVATICGMEALVFDRTNGKLLWSVDLKEAPGNGCELSETYLYIPLLSRKMLAYYLREPIYDEDEALDTTALEGFEKMALEFAKEVDPDVVKMKDEFKKAREMFQEEIPVDESPRTLVLDRTYRAPLACPSFGHAMIPPTLGSQYVEMTTLGTRLTVKESTEFIAWTTDRGIMHIASIDRNRSEHDDAVLLLRYQVKIVNQAFYADSSRIVRRELEQRVDIPAKPTFVHPRPLNADMKNFERPGIMILGTSTGYVLATMDRTGSEMWEFYAGAPVIEPIAVIPEPSTPLFSVNPALVSDEISTAEEEDVNPFEEHILLQQLKSGVEQEYAYISTPKGMYSVGLISGKARWFADGVCKFLAASDERIYGFTNTMNFVVLDRKTGGKLGTFPATMFYENSLYNPETDRVYVISPSGLIQCLTELQTEEDERRAEIDFFIRLVKETSQLTVEEKEKLVGIIAKTGKKTTKGENLASDMAETDAINDAWKQVRSILREKEKNMSDEDRRIMRLQMRASLPIRHRLNTKEIETVFRGIRNGDGEQPEIITRRDREDRSSQDSSPWDQDDWGGSDDIPDWGNDEDNTPGWGGTPGWGDDDDEEEMPDGSEFDEDF